jgi:hypothetical protein
MRLRLRRFQCVNTSRSSPAHLVEAVLLLYIARQDFSLPRRFPTSSLPYLTDFSPNASYTVIILHVEMNATTERVGWVVEPNGRGTLGLLFSCGATIFLSTYSAVHPNLPALDDPAWKILLRKIGYMVLCICAPELVAVFSLTALIEVRRVERRGREPGDESPVCSHDI